VRDEVLRGFEQVLSYSGFVLGREVAEFENAFAFLCGVPHCIGVGNGTDAIELALRAAGIHPGDEVIVPANTFIATALAVARAGAPPLLVDCDPDHYWIDPEAVARRVNERTRAIIAVHLYGQIAPMEALDPIARSVGAILLEDAAQAQGARRNGVGAGGFGLA